MATKEMTLLVKIFGLIGAIFVLIAQFVPWGSGAFLFGADYGVGFNAFYTNFFTAGVWQAILVAVIMILLFFLNLITLILGFLTFKNIESKGINAYMKLAILVTAEFIIYILGWSVAAGGVPLSGIVHVGFIMILLAMIFYWLVYGLGKSLGIYTTPTYQQIAYQQPAYQQQVYQHTPRIQQVPPPQPQAQTQPQQKTQQPAQKSPKAKATTPKFCPECGGPLQPTVKFCPSCGFKL